MNLYSYSNPTNGLPDPRGSLSSDVTPEAIYLANKEVECTLKESAVSKKRGVNAKYLAPEVREEIGKYVDVHDSTSTFYKQGANKPYLSR